MTCSAAGTVDAPGRNVRAKAGLNRSILRNGWSLARSMLEYKATMSGVTLVAVSPAFTSQQCHSCGHTAAENRRGQARFACVACGHAENADRNAARNILAKAQRMFADASQEAQPGGRPASTAGYAGTMPVRPAFSAGQGRAQRLKAGRSTASLVLLPNRRWQEPFWS
jgi:putative transposase